MNIDEAQDLAIRYGITGIPTLVVFKNGEPVHRLQGIHSKDAIVKAIESVA